MTSATPDETATATRTLSRRFCLVMIILAATIAYLPIVGHNLHTDDFLRLDDNSRLSVDYFKNIVTDNKSDGFYRPLNHLTFGLTYHVFGLNPYPYGVFNFLLVLGTCLLIFQITARLTRDMLLAVLVVVAWLANVEVVASALTWAVGRTTGMEVFFSLCAVQCVLMAETRKVWFWLALAAAATGLALLSKESGVLAGLFAMAAALHLKTRSQRLTGIHLAGLGLVLALVYAGYFLLRSHAVSWTHDTAPSYYQWQTASIILARNAVTGVVNSLSRAWILLPLFWILTRGLGDATFRIKGLLTPLAVCALGFGITLAPTLALPNASIERMYRYAYSPSLFAVAAMVLLLRQTPRWPALAAAPRRCLLGAVIMIGITTPLAWWHGYQTHQRQRHTLDWVKTIKANLPTPPPPAVAIEYDSYYFIRMDLMRDESDFRDLETALRLDGVRTKVLLNPSSHAPDLLWFELLPAWPPFDLRHLTRDPVLGALSPLPDRTSGSRVIRIVMTPHGFGQNVRLASGHMVRYWEGKGHKTPITLTHGGTRGLTPGRYSAIFRYRADSPRRNYKNTWGQLSVHIAGQPEALAQAEIHRTPSPGQGFSSQSVPFEVEVGGKIEARVTGGDAPLWLESVRFVPLQDAEG